jgi:hypothetical protein
MIEEYNMEMHLIFLLYMIFHHKMERSQKGIEGWLQISSPSSTHGLLLHSRELTNPTENIEKRS